MPDPPADVEAAMLAAAMEAEARIASCHEKVACPRCLAPVGTRCVRASRGRPGFVHPPETLRHPHRERWTQVQPDR